MSDSPAPDDKVTLTIDGEQIVVPKGTLIIRAAEQLGTIIPRFCEHPLLDPIGACRQCMVEIEGGPPKPMMACTTPVADDMVVKTQLTSEVARKGQEGTLEFLLINHPLDCPMCDKGGECPLQDQALTHGSNTSRFIDQKRRYLKPVAISEQILLDRERCVLCTRCTRFASEISGEPFIELFERSALEQVAIYEDEPYHSYFSGNIIQICPVGALTSTDYRFRARPFDVVASPSVCDHCSAGCTLTVQSRRGDIQRQLARTNMPVNEAWNCDKGRFGYAHLTASTRLAEPKLRQGGQLQTATWADALLTLTRAVQSSADEHGRARAAVLTGSRLADEDAYAVAKYARSVLGTDDVDFRTRFAPESETSELAALQGRDTATYADVEAAPVIVVAGLDPEEEVPILFLRLRKAWRNHKARIVVVGPTLGSLADYAWRRVATAPQQEAAALRELATQLSAAGHVDEVTAALRDATQAPVVLVGERAGAGTLTAAAELAEASDAKIAWVPRRAGARGGLQAGLAPGLLPGGRRLDDETDRAEVEAEWGALPEASGRDLHAVLADASKGKIDVLHLVGVDLLRDCDSPALAAKALAKVPTVVAQDLALTETVAEHADVVLPATGTQERHGSHTNWEGRTQRFAKAIDGHGVVLDDWEIVQQIAALLGFDLGFNDLAGVRREMERVGARSQPHAWPDVAPVEDETSDSDDDAPRARGDDSLAVVGLRLLLDQATMLTDAVNLKATAKEPRVVLNVDDAERLDIADGALVEVAGPKASFRLPARVGTDVVPGAVVVPANSTETPLAALGDDTRLQRVTVSAVVDAEVGA